MDGMDRTSRPQFQPSQLGIRQYPDIPAGLDAIFEAYQKRKMTDMQMGMQMKQAGLQETQTKMGIASQGMLPPGEETGSPYDQIVQEFIAKKQREAQESAASLEPKTIEALLVRKVNSGEMTLEDAMKYKLEERSAGSTERQKGVLARMMLTPEEQKLLEESQGRAPGELSGIRSNIAISAKPSIGAQNKKQALLDSQSMIKSFKDSYGRLEASGKVGVSGAVAYAKSKGTLGALDPEVKAYEDSRSGFLSALKSAVGESGVLTNQDMERLANILPPPWEHPNSARIKFAQIDDIMKQRGLNIAESFPQLPKKSEISSPIVERVLKTGERVKVRKLPNGGWEKVE